MTEEQRQAAWGKRKPGVTKSENDEVLRRAGSAQAAIYLGMV